VSIIIIIRRITTITENTREIKIIIIIIIIIIAMAMFMVLSS